MEEAALWMEGGSPKARSSKNEGQVLPGSYRELATEDGDETPVDPCLSREAAGWMGGGQQVSSDDNTPRLSQEAALWTEGGLAAAGNDTGVHISDERRLASNEFGRQVSNVLVDLPSARITGRRVSLNQLCDDQPPVRMLIFGDSWARSTRSLMKTWPELMADRMDWPSINTAMPGGDSNGLTEQLELLHSTLSQHRLTIHQDCWALIHAGGNDIMREMSSNFTGFVSAATGNALCGGVPCCNRLRVFEQVVDNVEELVGRLQRELGIKHVILVGLPLTPSLPFVSKLMNFFARVPGLGGLAHFVLHRLNVTYNEMLERRVRQLQRGDVDSMIVLDEAAAIEACSKKDTNTSCMAESEMWIDSAHLTQLGHEALADEMIDLSRTLAGPRARKSLTMSSGTELRTYTKLSTASPRATD